MFWQFVDESKSICAQNSSSDHQILSFWRKLLGSQENSHNNIWVTMWLGSFSWVLLPGDILIARLTSILRFLKNEHRRFQCQTSFSRSMVLKYSVGCQTMRVSWRAHGICRSVGPMLRGRFILIHWARSLNYSERSYPICLKINRLGLKSAYCIP